MQITWSGYGAFKIQDSGVTVMFDPTDIGSNFKLRKTSADVLVLSQARTKESLSCVSDEAFVIDGPGEYEVKGAFIRGIAHNGSTIYTVTVEGIIMAWFGPINTKEFSEAAKDIIKDADILLLPVGNESVLSPKDAISVINMIEPRIVIPAYYKVSGSKGYGPLDSFLKEYKSASETVDKLKIQKKDLLNEDTKVIVLTP